jgi:hypothetical protein
MLNHPNFLRAVLFADAAASGATGLLMIAGASFLAGLLAVPAALLFEAGVILVPYVALVLWVSTRAAIPVGPVRFIIGLNALWTLASIGLLLSGLIAPNMLGVAFILFQAAAVGLLGLLQYLALARRTVAA